MSDDSRFKEMVENSLDWFWEFDENANFTYASPRVKDLLGYAPEEVIGLNAFDLMSPEEAERVHAHFDPIAKKYRPFNCLENKNRHKDGHEVIIESSGTPIFDDHGVFRGYRGIDRDVTNQRKNEQKFHQIFNEMIDSFAVHEIICDDNGEPIDYRFLEINPAFEKMTGLRAADIVGRTVLEVLPGTDPFWIKTYGKVALTGEKIHFNHFSKEIGRHFEVKAYCPYPGQFACLFLDITSQIETEQKLRDSEGMFRLAFETNPDPVILAKLVDGTIIHANKAFEDATGIKSIVALGHNSEDLGLWVQKDLRETFRAILQERGEIINLEADFRVLDGKIKTGLVSAKVLTISHEPHILVVIRDISKEKEAERILIEMDQVKSEFISTAAHELRTPLAAMMGYTELLKESLNTREFSVEQRKDFLDEIYGRGESLSKIVDDLLDISRIESGIPIELNYESEKLKDILSRPLKLFSRQDAQRFILDLPDNMEELRINLDRHRIGQVLENLVSNAIKYSPSDTIIKIQARSTNTGLEISVIDNGIGMSTDEMTRVFDKFYRADTSDTACSGLGLGMSISKQIIEAHQGKIWVESIKGTGTTFTFSLPFNPA